MRRSVSAVLALSAAVWIGGQAPARAASLHPNSQSGVAIDQSFAGGDLDHVNLFNGSLTVTLPIGSRYPVSDRLSYGLTLVHTSGPWFFSQEETNEHLTYTSAVPSACGNVALGWRLSFGEVIPANVAVPGCAEASEYPQYQGPDGSLHRFYPSLVEGSGPAGAFYTRDGSFLRLRRIPASGPVQKYVLDFPDGTMHTFDASGRLQKMEDPFGNWVTLELTQNPWSITDRWNRTSKVTFDTDRITVELPAFGTASPAIYTLVRHQRTIPRGCTVFGFPERSPESTTVEAQMLDELQLPDGSKYRLNYYENSGDCFTSGSLSGLDLRTGGRIEWRYGNYSFPQTSTPKVHRQNNLGVVERILRNGTSQLTDPLCVGPGQTCSWTYVQTPGNAQSIQSVTTVTDPYGSRTKSYFSVATETASGGGDTNDYGAPISRLPPAQAIPLAGTGTPPQTFPAYLSTETFDRAGALLRQVYLSFDHDPVPAPDPDGFAVGAANQNRRVRHQRTVYPDDSNRRVDVSYTDYDGLGHYRSSLTTDNFGYATGLKETIAWNPAGAPGPNEPWILTTFAAKERKEGGVVRKEVAAFDAQTGFLDGYRWLSSGTEGGPHDVAVKYEHTDPAAPGQATKESWYGGDGVILSTDLANWQLAGYTPSYVYTHAYAYGVRRQTTIDVDDGGGQSHVEKVLDLDIDPQTGLTVASRDAAGLATAFEYDSLGRVKTTMPPGVAPSTLTYSLNALPYPLVTADQGANLSHEVWTLDPFGRIGQDAVTLPGPVTVPPEVETGGTGVASQVFALYNPMGWKTRVSEASSAGSAAATLFTYTRRSNGVAGVPDPFGRPWEIVAPDGKVSTLSYKGGRMVRRSQQTWQQVESKDERGESVWSNQSVWATTTEFRDGLGRLREVKDAAGTRTTYTYDPAGHLTSVTTTDGQKPHPKVQSRTFKYDGRGFLFRENPAESDAITYRYDARGNRTARATPAGTVFYAYDAAGRVTGASSPEARLKDYAYGTSPSLYGKLLSATAYNYRTTTSCTEYRVEQRFSYQGPGGRLSKVDTELWKAGDLVAQEAWSQSFGYDAAGMVNKIDYPSCTGACAAGTRSVTTAYRYGRPVEVPGFATSIRYNDNGTLARIDHANGVTFRQGRDPAGMARPAYVRAEGGGLALWPQEDYSFDGAGNISRIGGRDFTYDGLSRLTSATYPAAGAVKYREYLYDRFGNLTEVKKGKEIRDPGMVSQILSTNPSTNQLNAADYDASGRMWRYSNTVYSWDVLDQLAKVDGTAAGGEAWIHVYDAAGERVWSWRTSSSTPLSTFALRDPGGKVLSLFTKTTANGTPSYAWEDYVYREGQLLGARLSDGSVRHFDLDHLGSVRLETDGAGAVIASHDFWPYGEEVAPLSDGERMKYTGHERDLGVLNSNVDDMDYMHARYYRPLLGRFLTLDPSFRSFRLGWPATWNRYSYVLGNPARFIDPRGELWFKIDGKWQYLEGVNEQYSESTDKDGNLVLTVTAGRGMFVGFDGGKLTLYRENGSRRVYDAVSGVLDKNGRTQPRLQGIRNRGPIPEGSYTFNPALVQAYSELTLTQKAKSMVGRGEWPGSVRSWGQKRVALTPNRSTNTHGRGNFFIHGGWNRGSAGCIDLCSLDEDFFDAVGSTPSEIQVEVDYP